MFKCLSHEFSNIGVLSVALLAAVRQQVGDLASSVDTSHLHICAVCVLWHSNKVVKCWMYHVSIDIQFILGVRICQVKSRFNSFNSCICYFVVRPDL